MDRRVKERLIGATILVVLIVLIVPELLSGPKRPPPPRAALSLPVPTRSVSVDLATSKATTASAAADAASATSAGDDAGAAAPNAASAALPAPSAAAPDAGAAASSAPPNSAGDAATTRSDQPPSTAPTVTTLRAQAPAPALESHASTPKSVVEARRPSVPSEAEEAASSHRSWAVQLGSFANKENAEKLAQQLRAQRASVYVISSGSGPTLRYRVRVGPLRDREAAEHAIAKLKSEGHPATLVAP